MPTLALTGGAYQARSVIASAQRSLNLIGEPMPQAQGEPGRVAHYPTPGLRLLGTLPKGGVRGLKQATNGNIYAVGGNSIYRVNPTTWVGTELGTITSGRPYPVSMADNGNTLVVVDGSAGGWTVQLASDAFAAISDTAFYGADKVDYLDTYFLFNKPGTPQFYVSDSLATTFDPLWFANKESFSDLLTTLIVARREIWLIGERATEVWSDVGAPDFPFQEVPSVFIDHGSRAKYSVATYDDTVFWLSYNRQGGGIVLAGAGYQTKRISTYALEASLASYSRTDDAIGFVYSLGGHVCYVLTLPTADATWVYDTTTGWWHEWKWLDTNGVEHRHRANCCYAINGTVVVGDWENGNLYAVENTALTDNGAPIKRQRSFPHLLNEANRVYYRQFIADIEVGDAPSAVSTTVTEQVITWLPQIATLSGPTVNAAALVAPDWTRDKVYFVDNTGYSAWPLQLTTTSTPIGSLAYSATPSVLGVDPVSGDVVAQPLVAAGSPVLKLNPTTFATIATFGIVQSPFPSYPTSMGYGDYIAFVVVNGVAIGFIKEGGTSGYVGAFRVSDMVNSGFHQAIVSGVINNRGIMTSGGSHVVLTWQNLGDTATIPLYVITVASGAETYNPSSWPTTNPNITWATVGTIAASAIDPTWTAFGCNSIGYDLADGNVLMHVQTGSAVARRYYVIKVRITDAAVMWALPVSSNTHMQLQASRIDGALWVFDGSSSQHIDTLTGQVVQRVFAGTFYNTPGYPMTDSQQALALFFGNYTSGTNAPIAVSGTSNFTNGWGVMGGATNISSITSDAGITQLLSLDWSDDRGHSYGSPVMNEIRRGYYLQSLQWQRLGYARDRVWRLTWSIPMATTLQGAWIEVDDRSKS